MRFCTPSPAVASESSRLASLSLVAPSNGMTTMADAVTAMPSALLRASLPSSRLVTAS